MARHDRIGPLLVATLGVGALAAWPAASAQTPAQPRNEASIPEVVITASREADEVLTAKVVQVLQDDPYILADHIEVVTENGVVTLNGVVEDLSDMYRAVRLARRLAKGRRVVNKIEFIPADDDHD